MQTKISWKTRKTTSVSLGAIFLVVAALPASAGVINVGSGGTAAGCETNSLAGALLLALGSGDDEIRLATNLSYTDVAIHLSNWDPSTVGRLTITGGWSSCSDSSPSGFTHLDGKASQPVFEVDTTGSSACEITFRDLEVSGAGVYAFEVTDGAEVSFDNVFIHNNAGGVNVESNGFVTMDYVTFIADNGSATEGGGVRCSGGEVAIASLITGNSATNGGGLYASDCLVTLFDGADLSNNTAVEGGGGLYAAAGSYVSGTGGSNGLVISHNSSTSYPGGGINATDALTIVSLKNAEIIANHGYGGGGIAAWDDASVTLDRIGSTCHNPTHCSNLSDNVTDGMIGAATYASGGEINIFQTHVEGNMGLANDATLFLGLNGGHHDLEGVTIWNNNAKTLFTATYGTVDLAFVTAAGNWWDPGGGPEDSIAVSLGDYGIANLRSSILWDIAGFEETGFGSEFATVDWLMVNDDTGLPSGRGVVSMDPGFVNQGAGNLHLSPTSPAIDFCDASVYAPRKYDIDNEQRGFDLAGNPNGSPGVAGGIYDIGSDEVRVDTFIFADGFESNSTSAWSAAVP